MHWGSGLSNSAPEDVKEGHRSAWGNVLDTADEIADVATALLMARGVLRYIDYAAIGYRTVKAGLNVYRIWAKDTPPDLNSAFQHEGSPWKLASYFASRLAFEGLTIQERIIEEHKYVREGKVVRAAWTATIDGVEIGWVSPPQMNVVPTHIWSKTPERIRELASKRLWERAGSDRMLRIKGETVFPQLLPETIIETEFLRRVETRAQAFLAKSVPRTMVLDGEPGTGKTTAVGYLARKLNFRTAILSADEFLNQSTPNGLGDWICAGMELVETLKPDVLIVNDIDRLEAEDQLVLLDVFDNAKLYTKLVFVTTNHYRKLLEPVRRPGRLDDVISVPGLDLKELQFVAPELPERYHERVVGWPISYVRDLQDRYRVLGQAGLDEFDEVQRRLNEVREDGKYTPPSASTEDALVVPAPGGKTRHVSPKAYEKHHKLKPGTIKKWQKKKQRTRGRWR